MVRYSVAVTVSYLAKNMVVNLVACVVGWKGVKSALQTDG
jgi:hypothetical protein